LESKAFPETLLDEVRKTFTVGGKRIPPEIFRDFGDGDLADSGSIWVTVDVHAAVGSNLYADPIKDDGRWVTQTKLAEKTINGQEQMSYQLIGATAFTFAMRYPVEEALRAKARGGIAEIAHGI
jgi:hypothetical protein